MKKILTLITLCFLTIAVHAAWKETDVSMTVSGMTTTMKNGFVTITINSNGRISSWKNSTFQCMDSNGVYFDITTANGNQGLNPGKVTVIKDTPEMCEVLYSSLGGNTIFEQGYIMRKGVPGVYSYVIATGTATSANEPIKEARVCTRVAASLINGYVDYRMNGKIPTNSEMEVAEKSENTVQDATYYLSDGSIYTKYNWANYVERDTIHGLYGNSYYGIYNIPVSYEWINGGCERQELTVHATSKSPITIQMLQGEHFGGQAMVLNEGEKKLYGPFLILGTYSTNPLLTARQQAAKEKAAWPYQWFENDLYPRERGTVTGHLAITTGQSADSIRVILAQEKNKDPYLQTHGYQFWTDTDKNGNFTIPKVRPGVYHLYAYAKKGEITDMLEVDDITVAVGDNELGDIAWTPAKYDDLLWMIGENNRRSNEFNLCDEMRQYGLWNKVPSSLTYTIGTSNPKKDWYYAQTQKDGTWTVKFNNDKKYSTGDKAYLTISLAGCTNAGSTLTVKVNGTSRGTWKPGVNDAAIYRSGVNSGTHFLKTFEFPATALAVGSNSVALTISGNGGNGGFMYDCIKLEAGKQVTTGIKGVRETQSPAVTTAKYIRNGKVIIAKGGKEYSATGILLND